MDDTVGRIANPFAARMLRPGAVDYVVPPDLDLEGLLATLAETGWKGAIEGPHGTGKSALLSALAARLREAGKSVHIIELRDRQRYLPSEFWDAEPVRETVLFVDGYEQLGRLSRYRLDRLCRRLELGLVVTSHTPVALPTLYRTSPDEDLAWQVVQRLMTHGHSLVTREDVAAAFTRCGGNLREMLFEMYDLYEIRRQDCA